MTVFFFPKARGRNPALWDKSPFVFNQSPGFNEEMFQMTRVKWKGGLHGCSAFRNQIRPQNHCPEKQWSKAVTNFTHPSLAWFFSCRSHYWVKGSAFARNYTILYISLKKILYFIKYSILMLLKTIMKSVKRTETVLNFNQYIFVIE